MKTCLTKNLGQIKQKADEETTSHRTKLFDNDECKHLENLDYKDLYVFGRIWIDILKTALIGERFKLCPVVNAAEKKHEVPLKPPPMKYTDLPLYESPHFEYKDYLESSGKCPDANVKLLHKYLLPYTKIYREKTINCACEVKCIIENHLRNTCIVVRDVKKQFKEQMRDPNNLAVRQVVVAASGATGYLVGGGGGIPRRLFFTTIGLLTGGALCFPKETDEVFRNASYWCAKMTLPMFIKLCGQDVVLRERLPCRADLPSPPPARKAIECPSNK